MSFSGRDEYIQLSLKERRRQIEQSHTGHVETGFWIYNIVIAPLMAMTSYSIKDPISRGASRILTAIPQDRVRGMPCSTGDFSIACRGA